MAAAQRDLQSPLLPRNGFDSASETDVAVDIDHHGSAASSASGPTNPFEFIGVEPPSLPPPSPVDPFRNHTPSVDGAYEWFKTAVCAPLALARLALFAAFLIIGFLATKAALLGWKDRQSPMPRWRCRLMWLTRICSRCILFSFGYHWIRKIGKPVPREIAPIVVSNHVSYIEPIFFFYELFPTIVTSESHDAIPCVGTIIKAMQVIYVNRLSRASRKLAVSEIKNMNAEKSFSQWISSSSTVSGGYHN